MLKRIKIRKRGQQLNLLDFYKKKNEEFEEKLRKAPSSEGVGFPDKERKQVEVLLEKARLSH